MKKTIVVSFLLLCAAFVVPWAMTQQNPDKTDPPDLSAHTETSPATDALSEPSVEPATESLPAIAAESAAPSPLVAPMVTVLLDGQPTAMTEDAYLCGVLAAEMPFSAPIEALKAQAVAARTYLFHAQAAHKHGDADICGDYTHCMAYKPFEDELAEWSEAERNPIEDKVREAVVSTAGEGLVYQGDWIDALFCGSSAGKSESALAVWGAEIPYLQSVDVPWDDDQPAETVSFPVKEVKARLDTKKVSKWDIVRDEAGYVQTVTVGGVTLAGTEIRRLFGLRSHWFEVKATQKNVTFTVKGYGHGVGMSQTAAEKMAAAGMTYREILTLFYTGAEIGHAGTGIR